MVELAQWFSDLLQNVYSPLPAFICHCSSLHNASARSSRDYTHFFLFVHNLLQQNIHFHLISSCALFIYRIFCCYIFLAMLLFFCFVAAAHRLFLYCCFCCRFSRHFCSRHHPMTGATAEIACYGWYGALVLLHGVYCCVMVCAVASHIQLYTQTDTQTGRTRTLHTCTGAVSKIQLITNVLEWIELCAAAVATHQRDSGPTLTCVSFNFVSLGIVVWVQ